MTEDKKKQMMDKVKKLLAMADRKDGNENEAAVASSQAAKLLKKYNLSLSDISVEEIIDVDFITGQKTPPQWVSALALATARSFGCEMYLQTKRDGDRYITVITFMGSEVDIQIVSYVTLFLQKTIKRMAVDYGKTLSLNLRKNGGRKAYRFGLICTIKEKLEQLNKKQNEEMADEKNVAGLTGAEIVHIKKDMLKIYTDKKNLTQPRKTTMKIHTNCYGQGRLDGNKINIRTGLNAGVSQKELTG